MQRIIQPVTAFGRKLFGSLRFGRHQRHSSEQRLSYAAVGVPICLGDSPMMVDMPMMALFTALVIAAGISIGLLYRHMQERQDKLAARAQNAEEELRAMLTMTDDAVLVLDSVGMIRAANPAAEELFSKSEDDFAGEEIKNLLEHPPMLAELTKHGPANFHARVLSLNGEKTPVEVLLSQVQHAHGTSYLAMIRASREADSSAAATPDLVAQVCKHSHDINNQLTGIIGHLSLVLMSAQTEPAVHERLLGAKKNTLRAQETNRRLQSLVRGDVIDASTATVPAPGTIVPMPMTGNSTAAANQTPRVLVLDDEEAICSLVSTALGAQGLDVTEATNSAAAFKACEQAIKDGRPFHLVIADLSLSEDLSGSEAVARIRKLDPMIKAVVSSGYDQDPIMSEYRRHGFDAALAKPYELNKLGRVVREILDGAADSSRKTA